MSAPFKSLSQCLYMAYLMEVLPAPIKNSTQAVLEANMHQSSIWDRRHSQALKAFEGLSALDIRAQCALVRQIVANTLLALEKGAIWIYYGHLLTKAQGMEILAEHAFKMGLINHQQAALALAWQAFGSVQEKKEIRMQVIAQYYGLSKTQAYRARGAISQIGGEMIRYASNKVGRALEKKQLIASSE